VSGACERRAQQPAQAKRPGMSGPASRPVVEFSREEVFEACGRLSLAHQCLIRGGDLVAAFELASVLDLLERRVVA
jgi:hypothetical protein